MCSRKSTRKAGLRYGARPLLLVTRYFRIGIPSLLEIRKSLDFYYNSYYRCRLFSKTFIYLKVIIPSIKASSSLLLNHIVLMRLATLVGIVPIKLGRLDKAL